MDDKEEECQHVEQWVEIHQLLSQGGQFVDSTHIDFWFELEAKTRCLKCGRIDYGKRIYTINAEFGLKISSREDEDDGPEEEGALL